MNDTPKHPTSLTKDELISRCMRLLSENARLREALRSVLDWAPVPPEHWRAKDQDAFLSDMVKAREVLDA